MEIKNGNVEIKKDFEEEVKQALMEAGLTEDEAERQMEDMEN